MSSQMEWSPEFCLSCDTQMTEGGAYCSQACRLADLEKAGNDTRTSSLSSSAGSSNSSSSHGFYLPPAVNFGAYKPASRGFDVGPSAQYYSSTVSAAAYCPQQQQPQQPRASSSHSYQRSLTPSSSRSSLASAGSQTIAPGISQQAAQQLNNYERSFDQARDVRRLSRRYTQY